MAGRKKFLRILLKIFGGLFSFVLLTITCLSLILAQPQPDRTQSADPLPLTPSPAVTVQSESELRSLISSFPVPVMSFISSSGMKFVSGSSRDVTVDRDTGRVATLNWQTPDGNWVVLQSIYPASALSLLGNDYHFVSRLGPTLFGADSVYMEADGAVRLHACTDNALYVIIAPPDVTPGLSVLCQSLQLVTRQ